MEKSIGRSTVLGDYQSPRRAAENDVEAYADALADELRELSAESIVEFERTFDQHVDEAYTWPLWGAAYVINGGCSDDGFYYFRGWLVMQGSEVYRRALVDPDSLADSLQPDVDAECEEVLYVARQIFEEKTGEPMAYSGTGGSPTPEPSGEPWQDDDELPSRYPRLAALRWA